MRNLKLKNGMGGSRCGKGRTRYTAELKNLSRKFRRQVSKKLCKAGADSDNGST